LSPVALDIRWLGTVAYETTFAAMQDFTNKRDRQRNASDHNQLWICEHFPVFTQGLAGKASHVLAAGDIPVVASNRGGQVTYHGPGQIVAYPLMDLHRAGYFVKEYVYRLEESVIRTLAYFGVTGHRVATAPGIYVRLSDPTAHAAITGPRSPGDPFAGLGKISALGIKVSRHYAYHGLAINVAMDLEPFSRINPCGYAGLQTVDLFTIGVSADPADVANQLGLNLQALLTP
jgi:lipoyl(octanoyl) transferase